MQKYLKLTPFKIGLLLTFFMVLLAIRNPGFLEILELQLLDLRFINRGAVQPGPEVLIAAIDEKSQDALGRWPWPRSTLAKLTDKLAEAGVAVIGFDMVLSESGNDPRDVLVRLTESASASNSSDQQVLDRLKERFLAEKTSDQNLADSFMNAKNIILGYFFHDSLEEVKHLPSTTIRENLERIQSTRYKNPVISNDADLTFVRKFPAVESNLSIFAKAVAGGGFLNLAPDKDGIIRHYPLVVEAGEYFYPPLFLRVVGHYLEEDNHSFSANANGLREVRLGDIQVPADLSSRFLINYYGLQKTFPHTSIVDILNDKILAEELAGRIVLVGATGKGLADLRATPFEKVLPGVEINATIIDNILQNNYLSQPEWYNTFNYLMVLGIGLVLSFALSRVKAVTGFIVSVFLILIYFIFSQSMFNRGIWINITYPCLQIMAVYTSITAFNYFHETQQRRFIHGAFGQYLSPAIIHKLIKDPSLLKLGGEQKRLTAFFSDVAGFSSISENLTPQQLVELLNEYLTAMTNIVLEYGGTVDKYEGDAIIAFFGAPVDYPDHALRTCLVSLDMQKKLAEMRAHWKKFGKPEMTVRIGLNTGVMVVGNMGSKTRMDYTMMGDAVNLASRLEGVNKIYGTDIMISEFTYEDVKNDIEARELDKIRVVGKAEPIRIYEVLARKGELDPKTSQVMDCFQSGLDQYRLKKWDEASHFFQQALDINPEDSPSQTFLKRCNEFKSATLPEDWDGVYQMTSK